MTRKLRKGILEGLYIGIPFFLFFATVLIKEFAPDIKNKEEIKTIRYESEISSAMPVYEEETIHVESVMVRTTAYCACERCCGWSTGITCSGTKATAGRTVGANLSEYPIGTELVIDGRSYFVEDTGNLPYGTIDIFFDSHEEAIQYGVQYKLVSVKGE